jgi:F-type H+-transporting ATPase subunit b
VEADPVTIVAQILNFALLVFLLKRFLYRPVLDAMDRREKTIEDRLSEARQKVDEAESSKEEYQEKTRELEESKREVMEEVRTEARERSLELHEELRQRIQHREQEWADSLARETAEQLESFRDQVRAEIVATVREALADLADQDLDDAMLTTFLQRVDQLSDDQVERLRGAERPGPPLNVVTARPLPLERREEVTGRLRARFGEDARFVFQTDERLIAGVELRCLGHRLGWNIDDYLDALEQSVRQRIQEMTRVSPVTDAETNADTEESDARHAAS